LPAGGPPRDRLRERLAFALGGPAGARVAAALVPNAAVLVANAVALVANVAAPAVGGTARDAWVLALHLRQPFR
jgi:hypothetical protein